MSKILTDVVFTRWVQSVIEEPLETTNLSELFRDGRVLCKLAMGLQPDLMDFIQSSAVFTPHPFSTSPSSSLSPSSSSSTDEQESPDSPPPSLDPKRKELSKEFCIQNIETFLGVCLTAGVTDVCSVTDVLDMTDTKKLVSIITEYCQIVNPERYQDLSDSRTVKRRMTLNSYTPPPSSRFDDESPINSPTVAQAIAEKRRFNRLHAFGRKTLSASTSEDLNAPSTSLSSSTSSAPPASPHPITSSAPTPVEGPKSNWKKLTQTGSLIRRGRSQTKDSHELGLKPVSEREIVVEDDSQIHSPSTLAKSIPSQTQVGHVLNELLETEREYVNSLQLFVEGFIPGFKSEKSFNQYMTPTIEVLFSSISKIFEIHKMILLQLEEQKQDQDKFFQDIPEYFPVANVFLEEINSLYPAYINFCCNQTEASDLFLKIKEKEKKFYWFLQKFNKPGHNFDLSSYLAKPFQRICKYPLLMKVLLEGIKKDHSECEVISEAKRRLDLFIDEINNRKTDKESEKKTIQITKHMFHLTEGALNLNDPFRKFIREGVILEVEEDNKTRAKNFYLFNDLIVLSSMKKIKPQKLLILDSCSLIDQPSSLGFKIKYSDANVSSTISFQTNKLNEKVLWFSDLEATLRANRTDFNTDPLYWTKEKLASFFESHHSEHLFSKIEVGSADQLFSSISPFLSSSASSSDSSSSKSSAVSHPSSSHSVSRTSQAPTTGNPWSFSHDELVQFGEIVGELKKISARRSYQQLALVSFASSITNDSSAMKKVYTLSVARRSTNAFLHQAIMEGDPTVIRLLEKSANLNVNSQDPNGFTLLHCAVTANFTTKEKEKDKEKDAGNNEEELKLKLCRLLLKNENVDTAISDRDGNTPLHLLVKHPWVNLENYTDLIKTIIAKGSGINHKNLAGETPFLIAAQFGNQPVLPILVSLGADVDVVDNMGECALHKAVSGGNPELVEYFLSVGVDRNIRNNSGKTAQMVATALKLTPIVSVFARNTSVSFGNPLNDAIEQGKIATLTSLLARRDRSLLIPSENNGWTCLHHAAQSQVSDSKKVEMFRILLEDDRVDCSISNRDKNLVSHYLARKSFGTDEEYLSIWSKLVERGLNLNAINTRKQTALHEACVHGNYLAVHFLISNGADLNLQNCVGETPLHAAVFGGNEKVASELLSNGANRDIVDDNQLTPLQSAIQWKRPGLVQLLEC